MRSGIVLALMALALVGHVCVADWPTTARETSAEEHEHETLHAASCEAVASQPGSPLATPAACSVRVAVVTRESAGATAEAAPEPYPRPPRYVLHAALLI